MNNSDEKILMLDPSEMFKLVLCGKLKKFPNDYFLFKNEECSKRRVKVVRYLLEEILKLDDEQILHDVSLKTFVDYKLRDVIYNENNNSVYEAINEAYPGKFKPWEFKSVPKGYWNKETAAKATRWLIEEKLKWTDEEILKNISRKIFLEYGLDSMTYIMFNRNLAKTIQNAYPGKFKPWEFKSVPKGYWNKETAAKATRWLIEEKLKWNDDEIIKNLSNETLKNNGLCKITSMFKCIPYEIIDNAYPGKFKPWQLKNVPDGYWNKETAALAIRWLIEEKLNWSEETLLDYLSFKLIKDNGFISIGKMFNYSPYEIIDNAYPGKFKPWQLKNVPLNYWNKENARKAVIWLYEEKLKIAYCDIPKNISYKIFKDNGLCYMVKILFDGDYKEAVRAAYPYLIIK